MINIRLLLILFLINSICGKENLENEYRSNDQYLYLFTTLVRNVHETYTFCSKFGMQMISITRPEDEVTIRSQENENIKYIWVQSTFRSPNLPECTSKCCAMQMLANAREKDAKFRSQNCTDETGYMACQQVSISN